MTKRLDRWFVEDWRQCWRWFSTHALAITIALQATWLELPSEWRAVVPAQLVHVMTIAVLILGFLGRLMRQPGLDEKPRD